MMRYFHLMQYVTPVMAIVRNAFHNKPDTLEKNLVLECAWQESMCYQQSPRIGMLTMVMRVVG
jgi:hypothetical protein